MSRAGDDVQFGVVERRLPPAAMFRASDKVSVAKKGKHLTLAATSFRTLTTKERAELAEAATASRRPGVAPTLR